MTDITQFARRVTGQAGECYVQPGRQLTVRLLSESAAAHNSKRTFDIIIYIYPGAAAQSFGNLCKNYYSSFITISSPHPTYIATTNVYSGFMLVSFPAHHFR